MTQTQDAAKAPIGRQRHYADMMISSLDLSKRTSNKLKSAGIDYVSQLTELTEDDLLNIRRFGVASVREVSETLESVGLELKPTPQSLSAGRNASPAAPRRDAPIETASRADFIPYLQLTEEQRRAVNFDVSDYEIWDFVPDDVLTREDAAERGWGLDILVNDEDPEIRMAVARNGYGLDKLVSDEDWRVRREVARNGYGLDKLALDENQQVRAAVATQHRDGLTAQKGLEASIGTPAAESFVPYLQLTEEQKRAVNFDVNDYGGYWDRVPDNVLTREDAAERGWGLDVLVYDEDPDVRIAVARNGYGLDKLALDENPRVRMAVVGQGYELDKAAFDPHPEVRAAAERELMGLAPDSPNLAHAIEAYKEQRAFAQESPKTGKLFPHPEMLKSFSLDDADRPGPEWHYNWGKDHDESIGLRFQITSHAPNSPDYTVGVICGNGVDEEYDVDLCESFADAYETAYKTVENMGVELAGIANPDAPGDASKALTLEEITGQLRTGQLKPPAPCQMQEQTYQPIQMDKTISAPTTTIGR